MEGRLRIPAEWERHACCWLAFPHSHIEWPHNLVAVQRSVAQLCRTIADEGNEPVRLLVADEAVAKTARNLIGASSAIDYVVTRYGDCWVRDTIPLFGGNHDLGALMFRFNGWGGKFDIPGDERVGPWLSEHLGATPFASDIVLEGGALEFNGEGTCLTTKSCVLNPNRNPGLSRTSFEKTLRALAQIDRVIWLDKGLASDHTDGHVDMVARFVSADTVVCTKPGRNDPDAGVGAAIERVLRGQGLTVVPLPSPGRIFSPDGELLPANYCNFYVANGAVIVPTYDVPQDADARAILAELFEGRATIGQDARDLLCGGGAFHCITQPQPSV